MVSRFPPSLDSFSALKTLDVGAERYLYYSLPDAERHGLEGVSALPVSLKILLENLLRHEDGRSVTKDDIRAVVQQAADGKRNREIAFRPARVLMQDFTGVPAVVDLAAMRDAVISLGGDPSRIDPLIPVDLVVDHSVAVDFSQSPQALGKNIELEYLRNVERYAFLKWGQQAFHNFRVIPPGAGICHQVNLEYLAKTVWTRDIRFEGRDRTLAYPDTLVGTDSHTTMINGLAALGWGVGGIEAEAAMLGQPISMLIPEVVGFTLVGKPKDGVTATDIVLTIVEILRQEGVVGKFVEFRGEGLDALSLEDRATIANMAPEYGATCGFFPVDKTTVEYLRNTGREESHIDLVEAYTKAQGMFRSETGDRPTVAVEITLDLGTVTTSLSGPKRPQDRISLEKVPESFAAALEKEYHKERENRVRHPVPNAHHGLGHGDVVIAAITSCTNTSNPEVMIAAGLLARNALARGLQVKPWVKTSLAPGSQVVTGYLEKTGLQESLDCLGFNTVGYGCTTCIGNSGPLPEEISQVINQHDIVAVSVLSGNRNFEGRISRDVRANYLASPPLVVAYALAGNISVDMVGDPLGEDPLGRPVHLTDIWPSREEINEILRKSIDKALFRKHYANIFDGDERWRAIPVSGGQTYQWDPSSTYVRKPPYFDGLQKEVEPVADIMGARILALFLDSVTTDHISPAGAIAQHSPAGRYLREQGVKPPHFNSYGARRGNDQVMLRGTFANIRLKNQLVTNEEGNITKHFPSGDKMTIYDAAMRYKSEKTQLVILAGKEYGSGSSRDWAAKGVKLLGVRAVLAESFERIHRSNLIGMGVLPLVFEDQLSWQALGLEGNEIINIPDLAQNLKPGARLVASVTFANGNTKEIPLRCRIDTADEQDSYTSGGILQSMLRRFI